MTTARSCVLAAACAAMLALSVPSVAQQATGSVKQASGCAAAGVTCSDTVDVSLDVAASDVGGIGAIFVAVLPIGANGAPVSTQGGYATLDGWTVTAEPTPYAVGRLPATWTREIKIPGGICAAAATNGVSGSVTFGVFAGYGVVPPGSGMTASSSAEAAKLLQNAEATGDPKVIAMAKQLTNNAPSNRVGGLKAAVDMQQRGTVWKVSEVNCNG